MTTISENQLSIKKKKTLFCKLFCKFGILMFVGFVSAQSTRKMSNVSWVFEAEITNRLNPVVDTSTTKVVVLFTSKPPFDDPECSIRIVDKGNESFIEARILNRNMWGEQFKQNKKADSLNLKSYFFTAPVSRTFRDKMKVAFTKVIELHKNRIKPAGIQIYDGIVYEFIVYNNENMIFATINYDVKYDDFRNQVASTNRRIIEALKSGSFDESNYEIYK
jgi:hypothetical protein